MVQGGVRRAALAGLVGILGVACQTASSPVLPPGTPIPVPEPPSALVCRPISLTAPDGQSVFLSGTWIGSGDPNAVPKPSVYYLSQTNDCLVWAGLSAEDGEALGTSWIETFYGTIGAEFTIAGRWDEVFGDRFGVAGSRGVITVKIEFVPADAGYRVELRLFDSTGDTHFVERWVREGTSE